MDTGRRYVGLTMRTWQRRWSQHVTQSKRLSGVRSHFLNAIRKYGPEAFSHEVLEVCDSLEEANEAEERWIDYFDSTNPEKGFNLARGGGHTPHPVRRNPWNDEDYRRRSVEAARCRWDDPEYRAKVTSFHVGKTLSEETRAKISKRTSESNKRRVVTQETKSRISDSLSSFYSQRTGIECKRHGFVGLSGCYRRRSKAGRAGGRLVCKLCSKEYRDRVCYNPSVAS